MSRKSRKDREEDLDVLLATTERMHEMIMAAGEKLKDARVAASAKDYEIYKLMGQIAQKNDRIRELEEQLGEAQSAAGGSDHCDDCGF